MRRWARRFGELLGFSLLLAAPVAVHMAVVADYGTDLAGVLVAVQAALAGWVVLSLAVPACGRGIRAVGAMLFALTVAFWRGSRGGLMMAAALPHALAYLGLLAVFAVSLAPGREAIITIVARRMRGALSDELRHYTRCVTIAWCGFFAAQLAASGLLWRLAPVAWWSIFVNLGTIPLVALMFGAELTYRHWRHGIYPRAAGIGRLRHAMRVVGQLGAPIRAPIRARPVE